MMKNKDDRRIAIIYFSNQGFDVAQMIEREIIDNYCVSVMKCPSKGLYSITKKLWNSYNFIIFISSTGIAVRAIAPNVLSKLSDPAVLVIDEKAKHVISLLSGHYGGANALTKLIAEKINSDCVITTATDINSVFAFDSFANENHLKMKNEELIKHIARHMIDKKNGVSKRDILVNSFYNILGDIPPFIELSDDLKNCDVSIGFGGCNGDGILHLIPNNLVLGIGCRKGTSCLNIEEAFSQLMIANGISIDSINAISSIDLKEKEEGILEFSRKTGLPFHTYKSEELKKVETVSNSPFVENITGVGCVCESSAMYHAMNLGKSNLIVGKTVINHITFAICEVSVDLHWNKGE